MAQKQQSNASLTSRADWLRLFSWVSRSEKPVKVVGLQQQCKAPHVGRAAGLGPFGWASRTEKLLNVIGLLASVAAGATQPLMNIPFGQITDRFVTTDPQGRSTLRERTDKEVVYFLYLAVATFFGTYLYVAIWAYTGEKATSRLRAAYLRSLLQQDLDFHETEGAGALTANLETDVRNVQAGISEKLPLNTMYLSCGVTGFTVALVKDWRLGLALLSMLPCLVGISLIFARAAIGYTMKVMAAGSQASTLAEEALGSVRTVQSLGAEKELSQKFNQGIVASLHLGRKRAVAIAACMAGFTLVIYSGYSLAFFLGAYFIRTGRTSPGNIITVFLSVMMGSFALAQIPSNIQGFISAQASYASLARIVRREATIRDPLDCGSMLPPGPAEVSFDSVTFAYPSRPDQVLLNHFSLNFPAGSSTAIIGPSGAGKSTLFALLERFYDPQQGSVRIGGRDIRSFRLAHLRGDVIAYVPQEPTLFEGSIRENIGYGISPGAELNQEQRQTCIVDACKVANAHDFISVLPMGYETQVGRNGFQLSGGERARVALARAIVADPSVLLLDEISSNLDALSEQAVHRGLEAASKGRTTILVTHRLASLSGSQRVVVIEDGAMVTEGTLTEVRQHAQVASMQLFDNGGTGESEVNQEHVKQEPSLDAKQLSEQSNSRSVVAEKEELETPMQAPNVGAGRMRMMWRLSAGSRVLIASGIVGCGVAGMMYPIFSILYANAYVDLDQGASSSSEQNRNALWFFIAALVGGAGVFVQNACLTLASERLTATIQTTVFSTLLHKPIPFFDVESPGVLLSTLNASTDAIRNVTSSSVGNFISSALTLFGGAIVAIAYNWKFALVNLSLTPITLLTGYCRLMTIDAKETRLAKAHAPAVRLACEAATSIRTVALLAREESINKAYAAQLAIPHQYIKRMAWIDAGLFALSQTNMFFVIAMGFWYGSVLISRDELNPHDFFVGFTAIVSGSFQCVNLFSQTPQLSQAKEGAGKVAAMLATSNEDRFSRESADVAANFDATLALAQVTFAYPQRKGNALNDVDLRVAPGSYTALCGSSGSGKSTILALIERFYSPSSGQLLLGNRSIASSPLEQYRSRIALVTQEPVLYSCSIYDNLVLGLPDELRALSKAELDLAIDVALREASILETIDGLSEGLDTHIGSRGVQLSGGQRQRLVLARSILRRPALLLLDEATSSLDARSERSVQAALDKAAMASQRTTICVAHRLSTVRPASNIYVMKAGRVVDAGTFDELVGRDGLFADMVEQQGSIGSENEKSSHSL